eukprot:scaffold276887_cov16-Prasinocladus_malaysianus.AAC.1
MADILPCRQSDVQPGDCQTPEVVLMLLCTPARGCLIVLMVHYHVQPKIAPEFLLFSRPQGTTSLSNKVTPSPFAVRCWWGAIGRDRCEYPYEYDCEFVVIRLTPRPFRTLDCSEYQLV